MRSRRAEGRLAGASRGERKLRSLRTSHGRAPRRGQEEAWVPRVSGCSRFAERFAGPMGGP